MPRKQPSTVQVTKQPNQISASGGQNYLVRQMPLWSNPQWLNADVWREFVRRQPIAVLCREAITNYLVSLDWKITSRDSEKQDELKPEIEHYTKLFERGNTYYTSLDFTSHLEWIVKDLFDLPFGAAAELGRENDSPDGKVLWVRPLDGGTLAPTLDADYPVVQHFPNYQPVVFPRENVSRIYLSPRTEIQREGWGMPPPERIYLAMEMLNRGDIYYSQLLLNTPEAGILDLGDTDMTTATEWVKAAKEELFGINPMKIPVLAEHTTPAKWIPFGKLPSEIMYDNITARYVTILCAGYGLTPSDIGMGGSSNGGETLAGTIRQERVSAKSGKALAKKKLQAYFEAILPDSLQFSWIDFDDEKNVALSRARMANANAATSWITNQIFSPDEIRRQAIADGMFTITLPETLDRKSIEWPSRALTYTGVKSGSKEGKDGANQIGDPKAPSSGGQGEIKPQQIISRSRTAIEVSLSKAIYTANQIFGSLLNSVRNENNDFAVWEQRFEKSIVNKSYMDLVSETIIDDTYNHLAETLFPADWLDTVSIELARSIVDGYNLTHPEQEEDMVSMQQVQEQIQLAMKSQKEAEEEVKARAQAEIDRINAEVERRIAVIRSQEPRVERAVQSQPNITVNVPPINIPTIELTATMPEQPAPQVHFAPVIQPSPVSVQNNIPASEPVVNVNNVNNVETPVNNITVQPAPVSANVENKITVKPADVTLMESEDKPKSARIVRDADGRISEIRTE